MKSHAQVVVIGGGVVGSSVLYHLTKYGWKDVVLVERDELTSGSTWHAAGGMHTLNPDPNISKLQEYTIRLYRELEEISGQSCGIHLTGGVMMAESEARLDFLKTAVAKGKVLGLHAELITPTEAKEHFPLLDPQHFVGAIHDPNEGHIDPSGVTNAYAKAARLGGGEIYRFTKVEQLQPLPDGTWRVVTDKGDIVAEKVVNAAGLWAREVGKMAGLTLPVLAMEHHSLLTEDLPIFEGKEYGHCIDFQGEAYLRQEGKSLLIGTYEQNCVPWSVDHTPWDFGHELLQPDLERIAPSLDIAYQHFPILAEAGIKQTINGPFTFTPDGNPLVGPVPGLKNYYCACGVMAGFSQGGGVGKSLAEWMIYGEPEVDIFAMDVARFGDYPSPAYTRATVKQNYQRRFAISYPNEELPAGRPYDTTPAYPIWKSQRAVFGNAYRMEAVNYFAPEGDDLYETPSFRRSNAFEVVGEECRAVRTAVGINEIHNFSKFAVEGPGAEDWLNRIMSGRLPKVGRISLTPMLNPKGRLIGDFTISRLGEERFQLNASFASQAYHMRWFLDHLPDEGVELRNISYDRVGFQIAGPNARELLSRVTSADVSNEALPFLAVREMEVGLSDAIVCRVTYTGDLGYEIYVPLREQVALYKALSEPGQDLGLRPFGMRAMMSLRLEKSFGSWTREYRPDYTPGETGLDRFVSYNKPHDFIGREAAATEKAAGPEKTLCTFVVDANGADVWGDEPITKDGELVGFVTSGGYAHYVGKSVALGFLPPELVGDGQTVDIEILGEQRRASLIGEPLLDPQGARMRG